MDLDFFFHTDSIDNSDAAETGEAGEETSALNGAEENEQRHALVETVIDNIALATNASANQQATQSVENDEVSNANVNFVSPASEAKIQMQKQKHSSYDFNEKS